MTKARPFGPSGRERAAAGLRKGATASSRGQPTNIISCDVGWGPETTRNNAIAVAGHDWRVEFVMRGLTRGELVDIVQQKAQPRSVILLDVPIEGCRYLTKRKPRRCIEEVLQHYISLYPARKAGREGEQLRASLLDGMGDDLKRRVVVEEIYPHAIYKFLWCAYKSGNLEDILRGRWQSVLDGRFGPSWIPPKYKRGKKEQRLEGIRILHRFLTRQLRLEFSDPSDPPTPEQTHSELDALGDQYDACLGAVAGLLAVRKNPFAWIAGNHEEGEMLLLADQWLKARLEERGVNMRPFC